MIVIPGNILLVKQPPSKLDASQKTPFGEVVAVGDDFNENLIGKKVRHKTYFDGEEFVENDHLYIVCNYKDILIIY